MVKQLYVYSLEVSVEDLERQVDAHLGAAVCHWVADPVRLHVGEGLPESWKDQGAVFNNRGELRWWRQNAAYEVLLLTEEPVDGLEPLPGMWRGETQLLFLQNLRELRLRPNFSTYPGGTAVGQIEVRVYYRDEVARLVSLRRFVQSSEVSETSELSEEE